MVMTERVTINGKRYRRTYSDTDLKIRKIGTEEIYDEAIDIENALYTYEETDIPLDGGDSMITGDLDESEI